MVISILAANLQSPGLIGLKTRPRPALVLMICCGIFQLQLRNSIRRKGGHWFLPYKISSYTNRTCLPRSILESFVQELLLCCLLFLVARKIAQKYVF